LERSSQLPRAWPIAVLALLLAGLGVFLLCRARGRDPGPAQTGLHGEEGPASRTARTPKFRPSPGQALNFALKGNLDVRCVVGDGKSRTPIHLRLKDVDVSFALEVLEGTDAGSLLAIIPLKFTGTAIVGDDAEQSSVPLEIDEESSRALGWATSVLFRLSETGEVVEIRVDPRIRSQRWFEEGYFEYLESLLSVLSLFPSMPPEGQTAFECEVVLLDQFGFNFEFAEQKNGNPDVSYTGFPKRVTRLFGLEPAQLQDIPDSTKVALARTSMSHSKALGCYQTVRHHVALGTDETFARIDLSVDYAGGNPLPPSRFDVSILAGMERLASIAELKALLAQLRRSAAARKEPEPSKPPAGEVAHLLDLMDQGLAEHPEGASAAVDELQDRVAALIAANPEMLKDLESILQGSKLSDRLLLKVVQILGYSKVRVLPEADRIAVLATRGIEGEGDQLNALIALQAFKSDLALEYLISVEPKSPGLKIGRSSSLGSALQYALKHNETARIKRIVECLVADLESDATSASYLRGSFSMPNDALDSFLKEKWSSGMDRRTALKLLLLRSNGASAQAEQFWKTVKDNVFITFSDDKIVQEVIPIASVSRDVRFLEFLRDNSTSSLVKEQAASTLSVLRATQRR